jgi:hypothetical protein
MNNWRQALEAGEELHHEFANQDRAAGREDLARGHEQLAAELRSKQLALTK